MIRQNLLPISLSLLLLAACQTAPEKKQPDRFAWADVNSDGKLSPDEVNSFLVTAIFDARDRNKDGLLTLHEWDPQPTAEVRARFAGWDTNKDGIVSLDEAVRHGKEIGAFDDSTREADTDGDGFVSREEAMRYYDSKEGPIR
jgi:Ca2+-binding EF-hand superfamily protein